MPTSGNFAPEWENNYRESTESGPNGTRSTLKLLTSGKSKSTPLRTGLLLRASLGVVVGNRPYKIGDRTSLAQPKTMKLFILHNLRP